MSNLIGQSLGRYHILEQLGEGGMATVYKAYDTRLERDVAVKVIRKSAFPADHMDHILKRFERESKSLARLFHTNIVKVLDYGEYEGSPYMVLEYVPSGTLKQQLGKTIPWKDAIQLLLPVARALEYAHSQGVVHRDVKPSNILLTANNQPLLTDFGIAKILDNADTTTLTGTGVGVGTPEYMAPEQWTGQAGEQSDIYSLGVVLYEMITGRRPYMADTPAAILLKQATEPLPRPSKYIPGLPEGVEKLLIKALAKSLPDRFQSMKEFIAAMESTAKGLPFVTVAPAERNVTSDETLGTVMQQDTQATHLDDTSTRDRMGSSRVSAATIHENKELQKAKTRFPVWGYALLGGMVLLVIFAMTGVAMSLLGKPTTPDNISTTFSTSTPSRFDPTQEVFQPSVTDTIFSPTDAPQPTYTPLPTYTPQPTYTPYIAPVQNTDSEPVGKIVYACQVSGKTDFNEICLMNADGSGFRQLTNNGADNGWPSISPDGRNVLYASTESGTWQIYIMSLTNNSIRRIPTDGMATAPEMSSNGQIVFTQSIKVDSVTVMNADGSNVRQVYRVGWDPVWSPDGSQILFASGDINQPQLYIINADGTNARQLTNQADIRGRSDWSPFDLIVFYAGPNWGRNLYTINTNGSGLTQITNGGNSQGPSFSPDGQWIAFTGYFDNMRDTNGCEIYIIRTDGSDQRRLTSNSYCDWQPRWGP